ncbi:autotransporter domain-containing protein [Alloalcanivorax sp. C16-2]|uniref:autotransporter outer membrane beta-barrel domain-containing protein n=1 Tax=Alloalcanivorax sp. C16-2 TaxID=3390052 RepID=UPI003970A7E1
MTTTSLASRLLVGIGLLAPITTPVGAESIDVGDRETVAAAGGTRPSPWQAGSFLQIGGELIVGAGGTVENGQGYIGSDFTNGATGSATVTGTDALWANSGVLYVGDLSDGVLDIEDGGRVTALQTYIGSDLGDGQVVLSGDGSRLDSGNTLSVGEIGPGTLALGAGTTVTNDIGYVGSFEDGEGLVQVQGGRWENRGDLVVGGAGDGQVSVGAGGTVISDNGFVGSGAGGQGRVSLGGADAGWEMASNLVVGSQGGGEITVNAGATLSNGVAFVGSEAGSSGSVTVLGNGALWNNRGAILLGNNGNGELTIADGGTVRANGVVVGVNASGTGSLTLGEGGTLETPWVDRDAGAGTFYFDGGRFLASSDQDRLFLNFNDGDVVIRAGGAIIDSNGHDLIINTALDGDGGLTKAGTGTLVLNGNNLFRGASRVDGGALIVNGTVAGSTVTVTDGALLGGTGTLGGARLTDGATLAPGNSIGTLTVDGDLVFESGSVFQVEGAGDGSADRVRVTGGATLNGGSVAHIDAGGDYQPFTRYTLIDADQGVTGRFDQVSTNLAFLQPLLDYDSNTVSLRLVRNDATFAGMARTANQSAAANAAEQRGIGDPVHDALLLQAADGAAVRDAFDQLAGAVYASTRAALIEDSRFLRQAAGDRLRATQGPGAPGATLLARDADSGATVWTRAYGAWADRDAGGGVAGTEHRAGGLFLGADARPAPGWRLGALAGYGQTRLDVDGGDNRAESDDYHLGLFAGTRLDRLRLSLGLGHSRHQVDTERGIAFDGYQGRAGDRYDATTTQLFTEAGYRFDAGPVALEPFAGLARVRYQEDRHRETGDPAALSGGGEDADLNVATLGLRLGTGLGLAGLDARAHGTLGWQRTTGDVNPRTEHGFAGGQRFTVTGLPVADEAALLEAGLSLAPTPRTRLGLAYQGRFASDTRQQGANLTLNLAF